MHTTTKQTMRQAAADYLVHLRAAGRSPATIESYETSLTLLSRLLKRRSPLEDLTDSVLEAAVAHMSGCDKTGSPQRSEATLNRYRSTYRGFFRWAFETGRIPRNPAALLGLARVESAPTSPITPWETQSFIDAIRRSNDPLRFRDEALFLTYALTGLRRAEALGLEVSDYDAAKGILRVDAGKGRQARTIPVARQLGAVLRRFCDSRAGSSGQKVFAGRVKGKALTARQAQGRFDRWKAAAGLRPDLTIHSFRAGFATALHRSCGDVILVSRALGHHDLRPTLRYVEPHARKLPRAIERSFGAIL
jgi:site-specific recombinase XerC